MKHPAWYISDHLLPVLTLAFMAGIALAPHIDLGGVHLFYSSTALLVVLTLLIVLHLLNKTRLTLCLLLPFIAASGAYHGSVHLQLPSVKNHIYNAIKNKTDAVLVGAMATMAGFDGKTSQATIIAHSIRRKEDAKLIATEGLVLLRLEGPWPADISPGDMLAIRAELKRPDSFRTEGVFDYAQYLAQKNIWITGFVRSSLLLHKVSGPQSLLHRLRYLPERTRSTIGKAIDHAVSPDISGIYRAILLGDRSHVDADTLEIFKGSGTMHILAISGLHMAVIGFLIYSGLFWLLSRSERLLLNFTVKKWAAFLSLPVLLGYGMLAGMNTPVFRAVIMSSVVILAICSDRQKSPGALLASAAMLILIIEPLQLFTVSFQLSFVAITGIVFLLPVIKNLLNPSTKSSSITPLHEKAVDWLTAALLVSLVASLATAPITLYAFNRFSLVSPLANLFIEPLICLWSLGAGLFGIFFIFIQPDIASFLFQIGAFGISATLHIAAFFSSWSFSTIWLPTPTAWLIAVYYCCLIVLSYTGWKRIRLAVPTLLVFAACIVLFFYPIRHYPGQRARFFRITYLDVGQGTATLLEYPSGYRALIDGGGSSFAATSVGERIIAPFLWKKGIRAIDAVAITHADADHYNGLQFINDHFSPKIIWSREKDGHDDHFKQLIHLAEQRGINVLIPTADDGLSAGEESLVCVANLVDERNGESQRGAQSRNDGIVLKACAARLCALFPGDIGRDGERFIVEQGFAVQAEFLLSPHHGSITSNSSEFLAAVAPSYLLVSAGRSGKGHFPHSGLATECDTQQIVLYTTAEQGTLQIIADTNGYQLYGYRRKGNNPLLSYHPVLLNEKTFRPQ